LSQKPAWLAETTRPPREGGLPAEAILLLEDTSEVEAATLATGACTIVLAVTVEGLDEAKLNTTRSVVITTERVTISDVSDARENASTTLVTSTGTCRINVT
jgi:prephenate dehydratase